MNLSLLAPPYSRILLLQGALYCLPCGGCALGFLLTQLILLSSSKEEISKLNRTVNHFIRKMGTSPLSTGSLGSPRTIYGCKHYPITKICAQGKPIHVWYQTLMCIGLRMALGLALLSKRNWDMSRGQSLALTNTTINIPISEGGTLIQVTCII
jgi:hypothetical protein